MSEISRPLIVAVDFDGTLVTNAFPDIGEPNLNLLMLLTQLRWRGAKLILWTCRDHQALDDALAFCHETMLLDFDAVNENVPDVPFPTSHKIYADIYIDDRAMHPDSLQVGMLSPEHMADVLFKSFSKELEKPWIK